MRHGADGGARVGDHEHAFGCERGQESLALLGLGQPCRRPARPGHAEDDEVRAHRGRIQAGDAGHAGQRLGQAPGTMMVVGQAPDHAVRPVAQGDQTRRGQDAGLAHAAAEQLAGAPGALDDVGLSDDHRADRTRQTLRQAEGDRVGIAHELGCRDLERDRRIEQPRTVDVKRHGSLVSDGRDTGHVRGIERLAAGRVLDHDQRGGREVSVAPIPPCGAQIVERHAAVGRGHRAQRGACCDRMPAGLPGSVVTADRGQDLAATWDVSHDAHEVAHRATGHEQRGLLAQQLGRARLEGVDGRVVPEDVVAELGRCHRAPHGRRRLRDGVGTEIDVTAGHRRHPTLPVRQVRSHLLPSAFAAVDPWCSGPTCQPVTLEIAGSNPVGSATFSDRRSTRETRSSVRCSTPS